MSINVSPYEAKSLPELPLDDPLFMEAFKDLVVAVNGFYFPGERAEAITLALRWLRAKPVARDRLLPR